MATRGLVVLSPPPCLPCFLPLPSLPLPVAPAPRASFSSASWLVAPSVRGPRRGPGSMGWARRAG
eukprot:11185628-Lingulodinium_polyedra.AAC.1